MKKFAWFCIALACAAILTAGAYILTSRLTVASEIRVVPAAYMERDFNELREKALQDPEKAGEFEDDISEYSFVLVRADVKSISPFKTEWLTLTLDKAAGDMEYLGLNAGPLEMDAFGALTGEKALYITLLTRAPADTPRRARVEYYIHGRYHSIQLQQTQDI